MTNFNEASRAGPSGVPVTEYLAFNFEDDRQDDVDITPNSASSPNGKGKEKATSRVSEARGTPWADLVRWEDCRDATEMLHYEVCACVDWMSAIPEEHQVRRMVIEQIRQALKVEISAVEVTAFGSFGTNMYLPSGDIDLVVTLPEPTSVVPNLRRIAKLLKQANVAKTMTVVSKARVPIVKFTSVMGDFLVDISINQSNGLAAADLVNKFLEVNPAARYLVMIVKAFLIQRSLNEVFTGGLGSYSIICLVLSFLKMHPKVRNGEIDPMENLGVLLIEFFELYGHFFNFHEVGISLRYGGSYYNKKERSWWNAAKPQLISIEDPLTESNDVSVGTYGVHRLRKTFAGAFETIVATMGDREAELQDEKRGGRHTSFGQRSANSRSILGCILTFPSEVIESREEIKMLYHRKTLQKVIGEQYVKNPPRVGSREVPEKIEPGFEILIELPISKAMPRHQPPSAEKKKRDRNRDEIEELSEVEVADEEKRSKKKPKKKQRDEDEGDRRVAVAVRNKPSSKPSSKATTPVPPSPRPPSRAPSESPSSRKVKAASRQAFWQAKGPQESIPETSEEDQTIDALLESRAPLEGFNRGQKGLERRAISASTTLLAVERNSLGRLSISTSTEQQANPMSLSERIAALNKRTTQISPQSSPQPAPGIKASGPSVKDKAAKYDGIGSAPAPRGSFGLGAAPTPGQKTNRELYGNRIPSVAKPSSKLGDGSSGGARSLSASRSASPNSPTNVNLHPSTSPQTTYLNVNGPADPLTEEAVESLPSAVLVDPSGGGQAFQSVGASVEDDDKDATSSVAVEADDVNRSTLDIDVVDVEMTGKISPSLSTSTISESAMQAAPPILSPTASSAQMHVRPPRHMYDPTPDASVTVSSPRGHVRGMSSSDLSSTMQSMHVGDPPNIAFPLSPRLLQALQYDTSGYGTQSGFETPRSVKSMKVETGSDDAGGRLADVGDISQESVDMEVQETARPDTSSTTDLDLVSEPAEDTSLETQPEYRLNLPVLPLSAAHVKSLDVRSRSSGRKGYETPRSVLVEDGSEGARSPVDEGSFTVDNDYLQTEATEGIVTPDAVAHDNPLEHSLASPTADSPAFLPYAQRHPMNTSLQAPHETVNSLTPVAASAILPEYHGPSSPAGTPMDESDDALEFGAPGGFDESTMRSGRKPHKTGASSSSIIPEFTISAPGNHQMNNNEVSNVFALHGVAVAQPGSIFQPTSRMNSYGDSGKLQPLDTSRQYIDKPLPAPPTSSEPTTPTIANSLPDTPIIIDSFPPVPNSTGPSPATPKALQQPFITPPPQIPIPKDTIVKPLQRSKSTAARSSSSKNRPSTADDPLPAAPFMTLRRSASSTDFKEASLQKRKRPKKPQLVPGVWIGDDDIRDDDDDGPGWANIVVTTHIIG